MFAPTRMPCDVRKEREAPMARLAHTQPLRVDRPRGPQLLENVRGAQGGLRALLDQPVAAEGGRAGDRAGDGEHAPPLIERAVGGDERARAGSRLDDDGDARQTADQAIAARKRVSVWPLAGRQ